MLRTLVLASSLCCLACSALAEAPTDDPAEFFELKVRPILSGTCFPCHGGEKTQAGLRVDSREALLSGGERGAAVLPGRPDESLLIRALRHEHDEVQMPPDGELPRQQIDDLAAWIARGAAWPASSAGAPGAFSSEPHWAFQPLAAVEPSADESGPAASPIDRFIQARRAERGLTPVAPAPRAALLRRVYFDLIGLPPEPEEVERFLADDAADALARVVDRLLASPHYGERWGRHWLDVVRYADTAGDNADYPVPEARLYRDYVIDAFNADKPYDEFLREQLAGDLLAAQHIADPARYREQVVATGFLALARRYATAPYELWPLTLEDAIDTTGRAFLGLTLRCARCHDHKFDPVTQRDYYALYGIFASTRFPWAGGEEFASKKTPRQHFAPLQPPAEAEPRAAAMAEALARLPAQIAAAELVDDQPRLAELRQELKPWRDAEKLAAPPGLEVAYAVGEGQPGDASVHLRGEADKLGGIVPRGVPKFLDGGRPLSIPAGASGRRELADWLAAPDNPLTARVMVNRVWQWHFGRGLVATPSNFGLRGAPPTHPELLDWLARRFIDSRWSIKALHREIMLSRTYQLSSAAADDDQPRDPDNAFYWRYDRRRLDAEALRDAMLAVSGGLDRARPGQHPFPPLDDWKWTQHAPYKAAYPSAHRSVYLMTQRLQRHPYLALFDGPDTNTTTDVRTSAIVPSQALFLMNNPFVAEQAAGLAQRLLAATSDEHGRAELAAMLCWSRRPTAAECDATVAFVERARSALVAEGTPAERIEAAAWTSYARALLASNEFAFVD